MSLRKRIFINVSTNYVGHFIALAVAFFITPFLIHTLGWEAYGTWSLVTGITGYLGLMDFGIRTSLVKFVAQFSAKGEEEKLEQFVSTGFFVNLGLGVVVCLVALAVTPLIGTVFGKELGQSGLLSVRIALVLVTFQITRCLPLSVFHQCLGAASCLGAAALAPLFVAASGDQIIREAVFDARVALLLVALQVAFCLPLAVYHQILAGYQRFDLANLARISVLIVNTVAIVVFLRAGFGIVALGIITLVTRTAEYVLCGVLVRRQWPGIRIRWRSVSRPVVRQIAGYSLWAFMFTLVGQVIYYTDSVVISAIMSVAAVTPYAVASMLVVHLRGLVFCISNVFTPAASDLAAHDNWEKLQKVTVKANRYLSLFVFPMAVGMAVFGAPFISLWQGQEFVSKSYPVLLILLAHAVLAFPQYGSTSVMYGLQRHKWPALVSLVSAGINVVLSIYLGRIYGLIGVAIGTSVPVGLFAITFNPVYFSRILKIPLGEYLIRSHLRPFLAVLPMGFAGLLLVFYCKPDTWTFLILQGLLMALIHILFAFYVGLEPDERTEIRQRLLRWPVS
jgi:O-antigen/teichoic acid export membrane protein